MTNPLMQPWAGVHGLPPFADIEPGHFKPAFEAALTQHRAEIDAIAQQAELPTFANTVAAFDATGRQLTRLEHLFYTLAASATSPALQAVQRDMAAPLAEHGSAVYMHQGLFARIEALFLQRDTLGLSPEERRLLERVHLDFLRAGARLAPDARARYAAVMTRLAELNTRFAQNVLAAENDYQLRLTTEAELAGLPDFVRAAARQAAIDRSLGEGVVGIAGMAMQPGLLGAQFEDLAADLAVVGGAGVVPAAHPGPPGLLAQVTPGAEGQEGHDQRA